MTATKPDPPARRGRPRGFDRAAALRRAMEIFWEQGYEGASISTLAAALGINPPSLYAAFGSKEQLFREAVALYLSVENGTRRALREAPTARAAMEAVLRNNADAYADPNTPNGCLVVLGATTCTDGNRSVREYLAGLRRQTIQDLRDRLDQGVAAGELAPDTDIDALAAYVNTMLEGLSIRSRDGTSRDAMHAIIDCALAGWDAFRPQTRP